MLQLKNISESACQMFIFFQTKKKQAADQKLFEKNIGCHAEELQLYAYK